ncbi:MAG: putative Ig domain-containing protein, partial [Myxococcota bacterium]|nr:putative Ig domain-containing protein [Myxococcota bacterium]
MKALTAVPCRSGVSSADGRRPLRRLALAVGVGAFWGVFLGGVFLAPKALAAQTDIVISMAGPGAAPRIRAPAVIGGKPGAPFLYTIPATGSKPLTFSAAGLPAGLTLNAATGTIAGTTPAAGSYPITVTVSSGASSDSRVVALAAGDTLALTPPMGWNSYDSFGASVTEAETMSAAQAQLAQLQPFGWSYVVVDYLWFTPEGAIDANGRYLPSISKFPSATGSLGLKPLADKVHALGLSFGIHIMRGIPRAAVAANSPIAGSTYTAANAGNTSDPCPWDSHMWGVHGDMPAGQAWYDSIFAQYASWGIDFVKVDDMINNQVTPLVYHPNEVVAIRRAIDKTGRAIVLSLSPGPMQTADAASLGTNANMWRMVNDFWDAKGLSTVADVFAASARWQGVSGLAAGHWPDADMLPLGYIGPRCPVHASGASALSHNEQVSVMSLWAILPSPLVFGGNVPMLATDAATGPWTMALLTNDEVLAVNQDASGNKAKLVAQSGSTQVWAKDLSGGRKAVAFFNRGNADAPVAVTLAQLGISGTVFARDLWKRLDLGAMSGSLNQTVPWLGASLMILSPAGSVSDAGVESGTTAGDAAILPDGTTSSSGSSSGGASSSGNGGASGSS